MKHSYVWYIWTFLILACSFDHEENNHVANGFGLNYELSELQDVYENRLSEDSVPAQLIRLEQTPNSIIDQFAKLEIHGNYFIVLTQGRNKDVLIFDNQNGEFIYSFKTEHPHLLVNPVDFNLFQNKIYINDYHLMHLVVFDISTSGSVQLSKVIKSDFRFDKFSVVDNNHFLIYPYRATLNRWNGIYLNYDLLLLNSELELINQYLPYDIEKYHYGSNYSSTNNINFITPFYQLNDQFTYFSDLLSDTTYVFDGKTKEISPFAYHKDNEMAYQIANEKDLAASISLMEESGRDFGVQLFYMNNDGFIFSSVSRKKVMYVFYDVNNEEYRLLNFIDYSKNMEFGQYPLGLPYLKIDDNQNVYALLMPYIYDEEVLKRKGFEIQDNPAIVKYRLEDFRQ